MTNERFAEIENKLPKPDTGNHFTLEDIHKIREWHYKVTKDLSKEERDEYYAKRSERAYDILNKKPKVFIQI